jgi:hypothetical protein
MRIGITGHQNLTSAERDWLKVELAIEIKKMKIEEAYSCLAIGADQLFASIIFENKIPFVAIIPCKYYEQTFDQKHIELYNSFVKQANNVIQLDFDIPSEEAFYEAGKTVVNKSDVVIAIWNNLPAKGLGGTADIVEYAKIKNKKIIHFNPISKTITHINHG